MSSHVENEESSHERRVSFAHPDFQVFFQFFLIFSTLERGIYYLLPSPAKPVSAAVWATKDGNLSVTDGQGVIHSPERHSSRKRILSRVRPVTQSLKFLAWLKPSRLKLKTPSMDKSLTECTNIFVL